jgi:hypothetical protein
LPQFTYDTDFPGWINDRNPVRLKLMDLCIQLRERGNFHIDERVSMLVRGSVQLNWPSLDSSKYTQYPT